VSYTVPAGKSNPIRHHQNALRVELIDGYRPGLRLAIEARAYDDGAAFRYVIPEQEALREAAIIRERTEFRLAKDATSYPLILRNFTTSYEDEYQKRVVSGLQPEWSSSPSRAGAAGSGSSAA
jgi:alpha-glucosidase